MAVATERESGLFINGESAEAASGDIRELTEPATGEPLARVASAGEEDIDRAVEAARAALAGDWGKTPPTERSRLLHALADAIQANRKELAELEVRNVGKAISSVKAELQQGVVNFRFYASAIGSIAGRSNPLGGSLLFYSLKEPVGVVGQIVPWNYPLMMTTWKLAPALAAGCSVVLKPDSATPLTALRLAELAAEVGFPAGAINVVPGPGPIVGSHLVRHPGVDKVAFTGSTATGAEIMRLASEPIKRITLELGGKSPNLIFADAELDDAIPSSAWSIFYSAGQSCEPGATVIPFEAEKDAARIANETRYGLFATVWTADPARGHRLAARIKAGTVGINMPYTAFPGIPFGGYKQSGFGRELGLETLDAYLETKSVIVSTSPKPFNPFGL